MSNSQKYVAELLGTLVIVFVGTAAIITTGADPLIGALAFGLAWAGMWWVFGHVSGGHFNPAITLASLVAKRTDSKDVAPYIVCQIIGGVIGAALLWFVLKGAPATMTGPGTLAATLAPVVTGGWSMTYLLIFELLMTAFLVMVWLATTEKTGASGITGLGIGLTYALMLFPTLSITWSALNPVRTLGPALLANAGFASMWVFWVAPLVGGIVGAALWTAVVMPARTGTHAPYHAEA